MLFCKFLAVFVKISGKNHGNMERGRRKLYKQCSDIKKIEKKA